MPLTNLTLAHATVYSYFFSMSGFTPGIALVNAINPSIASIGASTSGSSQNLLVQLQQCLVNAAMAPDPSVITCVVGAQGPITNLQLLVNGVVGFIRWFAYEVSPDEGCGSKDTTRVRSPPPSPRSSAPKRYVHIHIRSEGLQILKVFLFPELAPSIASQAGPTPALVATLFQQSFTAASLGPSSVTCFEALEDAVNSAILFGDSGSSLAHSCLPLLNA